jgi:C-terminal processing protease CtpA/Prc
MKTLPRVTIVGAHTGGGSGMPYSYELPCGWSVRFSACSVLDPNGESTENGVSPSEGCEMDMDAAAALEGRDTILDFAINLLKVDTDDSENSTETDQN